MGENESDSNGNSAPSGKARGDLVPPLERSAGDQVHAVVRAGLGAIPVAGTALQEILAAVVVPPLERRRNEWMTDIGERLLALENTRGLRIEDLSRDEAFITTITHATQAAFRTHDEVKLEALKNAVSNAACPGAPEDALQVLFVSFVDQLSPWHLRLLAFFESPISRFEQADPILSTPLRSVTPAIVAAIPDLRSRDRVDPAIDG